MRKIPAVFAVLGLTAVGLAGCAIPAPSQACPRPASTDSAVTDLVSVSGDIGDKPTVSVSTPFHTDEVAFEDVVTGTGPALVSSGQLMVVDIYIVGGEPDAKPVDTGYTGDLSKVGTFDGWTSTIPAFKTALECATEGSRTVVAIPPGGIAAETATSLGIAEDESAVAVVDLHKVYLPRATGSLVYNDALGLPTVVRAPDGRPGVIIPDNDPPKDLVVQTLIKGDGPEVTGDQAAFVAYTGVNWDDHSVIDTTWDATPASISFGDDAPEFADALKGATVGSQVLVVLPPAEGADGPAHVYVVDILGLVEASAG
ncbi:FKBP-type peptidyl-prolyl cis-trans isomerase [Microbacterium sp. P5_E9]